MPYSKHCFQIRIRPGTTRKLSMPNQWAHFHRHAKPMGMISQASMSIRHTIDAKPMGTFSETSMSTRQTHTTVNVKSIDTILYLVRLDAEQITHSLHSKQSIFQLMSIQKSMLQVNVHRSNYKFYVDIYKQRSLILMYVFTILAKISISVSKLITIQVIITYLHTYLSQVNYVISFAQLMISSFGFTNKVQHNLSSYLQVNKYGDCCIYYIYMKGGTRKRGEGMRGKGMGGIMEGGGGKE